MEDSIPNMTPRELWQRAVSKVAAQRIVDDGTQDGAAFARVVKQRTFIKMVNSESAFKAAFGARSLRNSLSLSSKKLVAKEAGDDNFEGIGASSSSVVRPSAGAQLVPEAEDSRADSHAEGNLDKAERVARYVRVEASEEEGCLRVASAYSRRFYLSPNSKFNYSQFFRSFLYEALSFPTLQWIAVIVVETLVFGHTVEEAMYCAGARFFAPIPIIGERMRKAFKQIDMSANFMFVMGPVLFVIPPLAVFADLGETRKYIEPMELLPLLLMVLVQCGIISCKYGILPASYTSDAFGKIYQPMTPEDLNRTLILGAWNDPKNEKHFDLLKMEMENACLEADVDLNHTEINVGSAHAARAIRMRSRGIGERSEKRMNETPETVSGKELMAALVDVHIGRQLPPELMPFIMFISVLYGLTGPVMRAWCGVPMFGGTHMSKLAAAGLFIASVMMFFANFSFALTCAWHYRRQYDVMEALSQMVRFPGEPLINFLPPEPRPKSKKRKIAPVKTISGAIIALNSPMPPAAPHQQGGQPATKAKEDDDEEKESEELRELRRAAKTDQFDVVIDLKDPASCLCWSLVRRSMRHMGSSWARRMNLYSVIFLLAAFFSAGMILGLYFGANRINHRLATAASCYFLAIMVSFLVSLTVYEAAAINEMVPRVRSWLKRESVAIVAQMAYLGNGWGRSGTDDRDKQEAEELRGAYRLIETVEQYIRLEEEESQPVEVFSKIKATPAAVTFVVSSLLSMLLIAMQRGFTMMESEGWSYDGKNGEFAMDPSRQE